MTSTHNHFGIYIHIPFCKQACSYCDFYFVTRQNLIDDFQSALLNEINSAPEKTNKITDPDHNEVSENNTREKPGRIIGIANDYLSGFQGNIGPGISPDSHLKTIYFGGGTPSRLKIHQIEDILKAIDRKFGLSQAIEITLEVNPDDVNTPYLSGLKKLGVNRLSMGVQSFDPDLLKFMNRAHTSTEAYRSLEIVKSTGFESYSVDLIYGNPGQSINSLEKDLETLISFDPPHVSAYALTIEPETRLGKYVQLGRLQPIEDTFVAEHMNYVANRLAEAGIHRYEVSNFAKPGYESKHNSGYWSHIPYIGFGPGAHSLLHQINPHTGTIQNAVRWHNVSDIKKYISSSGIPEPHNTETLDSVQLAEERLLMGLRTKEGITVSELGTRYNYKLSKAQELWLTKMRDSGFIIFDNQVIKVTPSGFQIADKLVLELVSRY